MLLQRSALPVRSPAFAASGTRTTAARTVVVRADNNNPNARVVREYREDDNTVSVPGQQASTSGNPDAPLYADQVKRTQKPKSNLSKEMKERLRQEYVGFGGSENTAPLPRRPIIAAATVETEEAVASTSEPKYKSKWVIDENENLRSSWEHRAWTLGPMSLMAALMYQGISSAAEPSDWAAITAALFASYILSDLGTGIYHWSVDNYGDGNTPFVGRQIAAFQGHHQRPWTITKREFCNNVHQVFKPAAYPTALFLALSPFTPAAWDVFSGSFLFFICMSQQFHAWSHMKKSELPPAIIALQDANVLISRKAHGAHHRAPFEGNYCIVSGWWNEPLDNSGFFRWLERVVANRTGVEPRCWYPPEYEVEEEEVVAKVAA